MTASERTTALQSGIAPNAYRPPLRRPGVVARDDVVKKLIDAHSDQLVVVTAPAGYGKTTTMALWDEADERVFAWVQLDQLANDPVHLLRHVAVAIDRVKPIGSELEQALTGAGRVPRLDMVPALLDEMGGREAFVLVFDDLHVVTSDASLECMLDLTAHRPEECQIVLAGRTVPPLRLSRQVMAESVFDLSTADLAMTEREAGLLLDHVGVELGDEKLKELVQRTEGWPGGLYLAALALASGSANGERAVFSDRDRVVADYLVEEVLESQPTGVVNFLEQSALLDRMNAAMLDELLDRSDSGSQLEALEATGNMFLIRLDSERNWYRYHHLFGEMLRGRIHRRDPELVRGLNHRASLLLEQRGDVDGAIRHAVAADDVARAADLILARTMELFLAGRVALLGGWLEMLGVDSIERHAAAAIAWAWYAEAIGDIDLLKRSTTAVENSAEQGPLADGSPSVAVAAAMIRATEGWQGLEGVISDTQIARDAGGPQTNPWWAMATLIQGTAYSMGGELELARARFYEALEVLSEAPMLEAATLAHLALLSLYDDDLAEADRLSTRALTIMERFGLKAVLTAISIYPICALVAARCNRPDEARRATASAREMLIRLDYLSPRSALQANLLLARTALALGDRAQAREMADEAARARPRELTATWVNQQLDDLGEQLAAGGEDRKGEVPPITMAELRVLTYLPTHLSLQEIAEKLIISRNTAKSHSVAIYRKLGVSSRSEAVTEARRLGILSD